MKIDGSVVVSSRLPYVSPPSDGPGCCAWVEPRNRIDGWPAVFRVRKIGPIGTRSVVWPTIGCSNGVNS